MTVANTAKMNLDARIHDAYEAHGPSDEARQRVLASLKAAAVDSADSVAPNLTVHSKPRSQHRWLLLALPLAACLALAILVTSVPHMNDDARLQAVGVESQTTDDARMGGAAEAATASEVPTVASSQDVEGGSQKHMSADAAESIVYDGEDEESLVEDESASPGQFESESVDSAEAKASDTTPNVAFPVIRLANGMEFVAGERASEPVDDANAQQALALSDDGSHTCDCEVVGQDFVRYAHADVWYRLSRKK